MYDMKNMKRLKQFGDLSPAAWKAFVEFDKAAMAPGDLDARTKELIALGVAFTTQCVYCIEIHRGKAVAAGATPKQIAETGMVAAALRAGGALTHATHALPDA